MVRYVRIRRLRDISTTLSMATHEPVCNETPQSASAAASAPCFAKAAARPLARAPAVEGPTARHHTDCCVIAQKSLTLARAATERSGGPADRRTPERPIPVDARCDRPGPRSTLSTKTQHTQFQENPTPRGDRVSHPSRPPAALPQDVPHEADAREEDGPEPAHPPVDPHAHGQQDPLELEAAALAPHEARLVS